VREREKKERKREERGERGGENQFKVHALISRPWIWIMMECFMCCGFEMWGSRRGSRSPADYRRNLVASIRMVANFVVPAEDGREKFLAEWF